MIYEFFFSFFFLKTMEKSIAKTDTKEKGQRDWWLTNPSQQPKPQSLLRDITTQSG
jgi:hypothetical protein